MNNTQNCPKNRELMFIYFIIRMQENNLLEKGYFCHSFHDREKSTLEKVYPLGYFQIMNEHTLGRHMT